MVTVATEENQGSSMTTRRLDELRKSREDQGAGHHSFLGPVFDSSPLAVLIVDRQGRIVHWNKKAGATLLPPAAWDGTLLLKELFSSQDDVEFLLFSLDQRGTSVARELFLKTPDGPDTPYLVTLLSWSDPSGGPGGLLCYADELQEIRETRNAVTTIQSRLEAEIEERRQTEGALQQTTAKLQEMVYEYGHRHREATLLSEMGEFLQASQSPEEAYPLITRFAQDLFPGTSGALFMLDSHEETLEKQHQWGEPLLQNLDFPPHDCWAARRGKPQRVQYPGNPIGCRHMGETGGLVYCCSPLINQGQTIGLLHIQQRQEEAFPVQDEFLAVQTDLPDEKLVATFTDHIALALANQRLKQELRHLAIRDPLTGLYNRRYMEESLVREIHRARRRSTSLGILMLDIDHFKNFNDAHGHESGDLLLKMLGNFLKDSIRSDDIPCRYGGEEFTLILPEISMENARARAETIREGAARLRVHCQGVLLEQVTLSIGIALFPQDGSTWEVLLRHADKALYLAKELGRNQVATTLDLP
jgi:diguanylate cyclase (GGDEF)-like protein